MRLYRIIVKTAFQNTDTAVEELRLYSICKTVYGHRDGVFTFEHDEERDQPGLIDILSEKYGYKSLRKGSGGNRAKKIEHIKDIMKNSVLFRDIRNGYYRIIGKQHFTKGKGGFFKLDESILNKARKQDFAAICIGLFSDNKTIDYKTLSQITGYSKSAVFNATKKNHENGLIQKYNNLIIVDSFDTHAAAETRRRALWKERGILSRIIDNNGYRDTGRFCLVFMGANSYSSRINLAKDFYLPKKTFLFQDVKPKSSRFKAICKLQAGRAVNRFVNICEFKKLLFSNPIDIFVLDHEYTI